MNHVEQMVEEGSFASKSEFQRFAVEYVLSEISDHEPQIVDFDDICMDVFPRKAAIKEAEPAQDGATEFIEVAARVRQLAIRGDVGTAREYVDTQYPPTDPRSMLLDDLLVSYPSVVV